MSDATDEALHHLSCKLADEGRLLEAGWVSLRMAVIPPNAPAIQIDEMRMAYMAGAQHLFASIMTILDPGEEPSEADLRKMDLIGAELDAFAEEMELRIRAPQGSA